MQDRISPEQNIYDLTEKIRGTPAYFGFRINKYWERIIAFIDSNNLKDAEFSAELEELDSLNSKLPLPRTGQECEERENRFRFLSQKFANSKNLTPEQFWADFDPEEGLMNINTLEFLDKKNKATF